MLPTIATRMRETGGRTSGFDYLRFGLATSIILWHGILISYGPQVELGYWRGPIGIAYHFVLPVFFALSGFLVAGSLDRCPTLVSFFALRVLRIVPALSVEVLLSALVFGPLLTSLPLARYVSDSSFALYFLNILGDIHFRLPGLFADNPFADIVNAQLWTIPYELMCYLALGGLAVATVLRWRLPFLVFVVALQGHWVWQAIKLGDTGSSNGASGETLLIAFLSGIVFHLYRDRIVLHGAVFAAVSALAAWLSSLPHGSYYLPFPATYMTVYLGLLNPRPNRFLRSGDYSYGLYLYGFPMQQVVASFGPAAQHWWINVALAFPITLAVAIGSWRFIERPALSLRRYIPGLEASVVAWATVPNGAIKPVTRGVMNACSMIAGPLGTFLLVDAHEAAGTAVILAAFGAGLAALRLGTKNGKAGAVPMDHAGA